MTWLPGAAVLLLLWQHWIIGVQTRCCVWALCTVILQCLSFSGDIFALQAAWRESNTVQILSLIQNVWSKCDQKKVIFNAADNRTVCHMTPETASLPSNTFQVKRALRMLFTFIMCTPHALPPGHICGPPKGRRCCAAGRGYGPPLTNRVRSGRSGGWWCRTGGAHPQSYGSKPVWWTCSNKERN